MTTTTMITMSTVSAVKKVSPLFFATTFTKCEVTFGHYSLLH